MPITKADDWAHWAQAVRAGVKDPNWRATPEAEKQRKEAFKQYCEDLRAQEKHKEADRQAKLRSDFTRAGEPPCPSSKMRPSSALPRMTTSAGSCSRSTSSP